MTEQNGPITLIVGGSSGIGRALANALARQRLRVALVSHQVTRLDRVAQQVRMFGGEPLPIVSDVRDPESVQAALAQVLERWGRIDTAHLSAGISEATDSQHYTTAALDHIFRVNVYGVAHWLEALQPALRAQPGGGTIVVYSSLSADRGLPGGSANYSASKAAVSQLCDGLRAPWARQGIRLVTVQPGFVSTPMTEGMAFKPAEVTAEQSATIILDGLRRGKRVIRFSRPASVAMGLARILPPSWLDLLYREEDIQKGH